MLSLLKKLKKLGYEVKASGGTYWLGLIPVLIAWAWKAPIQIEAASVGILCIWLVLCFCTIIPDTWLNKPSKQKKATYIVRNDELSDANKLLHEKLSESELKNTTLKKYLLRQYSFRITSKLRGKGINVQWDFTDLTPLESILNGDKLHIKFTGSAQYLGADICFKKNGILMLSLIQVSQQTDEDTDEAVVSTVVESVPSSEDVEVIEKWMNAHMLELSEKMCNFIPNGIYSYTIPAAKLPDKKLWAKMCDRLKKEEFDKATISDEGIVVEVSQGTEVA